MDHDENGTMLIRSLDDAVEAVYRVALTSYQEATARARRLDHAQHGRPLETQDPELRREQANAWDAVGQWLRNLIETAPDAPTSWWPGAWLGATGARPFGHRGLPGQLDDMNVWPTEDAAHAGRPEGVPAEKWTVTWTPTARNDFGEVPLDQTFWAEHPETPPPASAPGQAQG
ncbi:hypothetical protein GCM10029964_093080 [Kibdelosporangium lantanae]